MGADVSDRQLRVGGKGMHEQAVFFLLPFLLWVCCTHCFYTKLSAPTNPNAAWQGSGDAAG